MTPTLLIHAMVRQTMVLVAALATAAGQRAPLAAVADQVFNDLVKELKEQGLGNKVIADMFGMALRTYHTRVARLAGSHTDQGRSLWSAVLERVGKHGPLLRADVLARFTRDDEAMVRSVLRDLVASGHVYQSGRGDATTYKAADPGERQGPPAGHRAIDSLVLVTVYQRGPITRDALAEIVPLEDPDALDAAIERLIAEGLVARAGEGAGARYACAGMVIPFGDEIGWEAAVFDHYQAMVTALVTKLGLGKRRADLSDRVGGSTFVFDVWPGHPMAEEALGMLRTMREVAMGLRQRIDAHNRSHARPDAAPWIRVIHYVGQSVRDDEHES